MTIKLCEFIIPCRWITDKTNMRCPVDNGNIKSCKYDTRSHPALGSNAELCQIIAEEKSEARKQEREQVLKRLNSLCDTRQSRYEDQNTSESEKEFLRGMMEGTKMARSIIQTMEKVIL